jgi:ribosomal protein S25
MHELQPQKKHKHTHTKRKKARKQTRGEKKSPKKKTSNLEKAHHKRKADYLSLEEKRGKRKNLEKECKRASYVMYTKPTPVLVARVTLGRGWCGRRQLSLLVGALDLISHGEQHLQNPNFQLSILAMANARISKP